MTAPTARSRWHHPIANRHLRTAAVAVVGATLVFGAGWVTGARDPLLAPVQVVQAPASAAGLTVAERVSRP